MKKSILISLIFLGIIFSAQAKDVSIKSKDCTLKGTLEVPKTSKPIDVVLIISGSGPTDRNGNSTQLPGKNNSLKMLADLFYENGIASLRYDKRGIGESESGKVDESKLKFDMYVDDAVNWIHYLKKDKRFSRIIVAGHSEGSLIGMIAARKAKADMFISLCGAGERASSLIKKQLSKRNLPYSMLTECFNIIESLNKGKTVKNINPQLSVLFRPSVQPYLISWFKYDPANEISKLKMPILIIEGTTDIQVDIKDAKHLAEANKNSKLMIVKNMNHILKDVPTKNLSRNFLSYSNPKLKLSKQFCTDILAFIKKR